jgi:SAM-dependent methyltransferase
MPALNPFPAERPSGNGYAALEVEPIDPLELAVDSSFDDTDDFDHDESSEGEAHVIDMSTPPPPPMHARSSAEPSGEVEIVVSHEGRSVDEPEVEVGVEPGSAGLRGEEDFRDTFQDDQIKDGVPQHPHHEDDEFEDEELEDEDDELEEGELEDEPVDEDAPDLGDPEDDDDEDKRPSGEFEELDMDADTSREEGPVRRSLGPPPPPPPVGRLSMADPPDLRTLTRSARVQELRPSKPRTHPWWEVFFDDDYLRTVRSPTPAQVGRQCDFLERRLKLKPGATVLDVGCGLGLPVIELTARGYLGVGLDLSLAMLSRASEEAQSRGMRINFLHADMREMNFEGSFDAVTCLGTTLGYFDDETNRKVIERFYRALKPGGSLLLDVVNRDHVIRSQPNLVWFEGDGCVCMEESEFNFFTSRLHIKRTVIIDTGKQLEHEYSLRLYSLHELGQILHFAGFRVTEVSGRDALPGVFFGQESPNLMVVAERRGGPMESGPKSADGTGRFSAVPE